MKDLLHKFTSPSSNPDPENPLDPLPGMMYSIVDREGRELFCHGEGARDILYPEVPIDDKTVMFLGSLTKLVTAIGCLIAVEEGRIALDDWEALYKIVPEIPAKQILMGFDEDYEPIWKDVPEHCPKITMRLLLTHISGFGTTFFSEDLWDFHERDIWQDDIFGGWEWMEQSPLINEPGAVWQYGV